MTAAAMTAEVQNRPSDLFITRAALRQRKLAPDLHAEAAAFCALSKVLADDPSMAVRYLLEIARYLCDAGTAGLSLLRHDPAGRAIVRWEAISGALSGHEGTDTPINSSPCGLCLDAGTTILVSRPERSFDCLRDAAPPVAEGLIVPLYDSLKNPLGTLWVARHDAGSHFSSNDARIVEQLAAQLVLILRLQQQARERAHALALLESHQMAQRNLLVCDLYRECRRHEQAERASDEALAFKDAIIQEVNHRTKNTLQAAASLLYIQARATSSTQVREALRDSRRRLQVLAHTHELLCSNPDSTQTILMPSLLKTLGDALEQSFTNASSCVRFELDCDAIALPTEAAIAIALFANEAVTNAYKHAFPNDSAGVISVQLRCAPENTLILRIADTGIGAQPSHSEDGVGLKLMRMLATQLHGALHFVAPADGAATQADASGTVITLTMERPARHEHLSDR